MRNSEFGIGETRPKPFGYRSIGTIVKTHVPWESRGWAQEKTTFPVQFRIPNSEFRISSVDILNDLLGYRNHGSVFKTGNPQKSRGWAQEKTTFPVQFRIPNSEFRIPN